MRPIRRIKIDAAAAFYEAKCYHDTADTLEGRIFGDGYRALIAPVIVNRALAIEMYIKALLSIEGSGEIKALHKVVELFSELSQTSRDEINRIYEASIVMCRGTRPSREVIDGKVMVLDPFKDVDFDLADQLDELNDAFVDWRYKYEDPSKLKQCAMIGYVQNAIRKRLEQIKPGLIGVGPAGQIPAGSKGVYMGSPRYK